MGRSQDSFGKKEKDKKRLRKRKEKLQKKEDRKANSQGGGLDNMIAYVDEFGNITDSPPDPAKKAKVKAEDIVVGVPKKEKEDPHALHKGKLEFFNNDKGYGFIKDLDTQDKIFVHINNMLEEILENDKVVFEVERGPKGLNAIEVKKA